LKSFASGAQGRLGDDRTFDDSSVSPAATKSIIPAIDFPSRTGLARWFRGPRVEGRGSQPARWVTAQL